MRISIVQHFPKVKSHRTMDIFQIYYMFMGFSSVHFTIIFAAKVAPCHPTSAVTSTVSGRQSRCFQVRATRSAGEGTVDSIPSSLVEKIGELEMESLGDPGG